MRGRSHRCALLLLRCCNHTPPHAPVGMQAALALAYPLVGHPLGQPCPLASGGEGPAQVAPLLQQPLELAEPLLPAPLLRLKFKPARGVRGWVGG